MFYRLRTYRIILILPPLSWEFPVFEHFKIGKIDRTSEQFSELQEAAQTRLSAIYQRSRTGLLAKLERHVALSKLNAQLSFYGWAIKRDGTMIEVRVRGEPVDLGLDSTPKHPQGSIEELNERARQCFIETGVIIDPSTGRRLPHSERHRFGIT